MKRSLIQKPAPDVSSLQERFGPFHQILCKQNSPGHGDTLIVRTRNKEDKVLWVREVDEHGKRTVADQIRDLGSTLGLDPSAAEALIAGGLTLKEASDELIRQAGDQRRKHSDIPDLLSVERLLELKLQKPKAYIVNLLHEGETVAIAGRPKVGKSRFVMQMALALVNGDDFLSCKVSMPATVLMLDFENKAASLSTRFQMMNGGTQGHGRLFIWSARSLSSELPDGTVAGAKRLQEIVEQVRPDVLIIDPWRLWLDGDENNATDVVCGLKVLAGLRDRLPHLAIVVVHHVRKEKFENPKQLIADPSLWSDSLSGHHALMSHIDGCCGLERSEDLIVFGGIARNAEPSTLILDEGEDLRFMVAGNEVAALKIMSEAQGAIWEAAKTLHKFTYTALLKKASTKNRKAVTAALRTAENHGLLIRDGDQYIVVNGKG